MTKTGAVVPAGMTNVVMRLLQRDPARRFQSARDLRDALQRVAAGGTVEAVDAAPAATPAARPQTPPAQPTPRPAAKPRRKGRLVFMGIVAIALSGGAYYLQPWGRTLDAVTLQASLAGGAVDRMWIDDGGVGGYLAVGPELGPVLPLMSPFFMSVPTSEIPQTDLQYL